MPSKKRVPVKRMFLSSAIIGLLIAFGYEPLHGILSDTLLKKVNISPWEDITASVILGIFYLGLLIYLFVMMNLSLFASGILKHMVTQMRCKEILPPGFHMKKMGGYSNSYSNILKIFDLFIHSFLNVKQDKDKFKSSLGKYLDPSLHKEIEQRGINEIYVGGKKKTATIFFSDIRGFTSYTENSEPEKVVMMLNEYFTIATKAIQKNRGRVNKYIGDAVMAVFEEAPKYIDYLDADKAILSALDIQVQFAMKLKEWQQKDPALNIGLGIGLARGEIITGNMGSEERLEYTVIGDTVNFASRLCGTALHGQIIISEEVYNQVESLVEVDSLPPVEVKGKSGFHNVYSVKTRKMLI